MIKYIGIFIALAGAGLLAFVIAGGRKKNIAGIKSELNMILGSGYVTTHTAESQTRTVLDNMPVKVPPRKRVLSREAADILKLVEEERQAERDAEDNASRKKTGKAASKAKPKAGQKRGTDILPAPQRKHAGNSTDILNPSASSKGTDVMTSPKKQKTQRSTDVLGESAAKGTDVLGDIDDAEASRTSKGGTDVLQGNSWSGNRKALKARNEAYRGETAESGWSEKQTGHSTDVLPTQPRKSPATDILVKSENAKQRANTDVLPEPEKKRTLQRGTDVLREPAGSKATSRKPAGDTDMLISDASIKM